MQCFLAFDKGKFYDKKDRFYRISLDNIDNDLKKICDFTMNFYDSKELKEFLLEKNPNLSKYRFFDLVIVSIHHLIPNLVPYQKHEEYFNFGSLVQLIANNMCNPAFARSFFLYFVNKSYLQSSFYDLKAAVSEKKEPYIIEDAVRSSVEQVCYKDKTQDFRQYYLLAMFVISIVEHLDIKYSLLNAYNSFSSSSITPFSDIQEEEYEWLQTRARIRKEKNN